VEHLGTGNGSLGDLVLKTYDLDLVANLDAATLYTAGGNGATTGNGEDVLDGHEEGLVSLAVGSGDPSVNCVHEFLDASILGSIGIVGLANECVKSGAKSPLWKKIIANVMNLKVDVPENEEGPSMGGAMLAAVGCGEYPDVETICNKLVRVVDTVEPEPELVAKYEEKYRKFRKLYPAMKELFR